jgi:hypothetical protein
LSGIIGVGVGVAVGFDIPAAFRFQISIAIPIPTPTPIGLALVMLMFFITEADIRLFIAQWLLDLSNVCCLTGRAGGSPNGLEAQRRGDKKGSQAGFVSLIFSDSRLFLQ